MKDPLMWFDSPLKITIGILVLLGAWAWFNYFKKQNRRHRVMSEVSFPKAYFEHNLEVMERRIQTAEPKDWCWEIERLIDHSLHLNLKEENRNDAGFSERVQKHLVQIDNEIKLSSSNQNSLSEVFHSWEWIREYLNEVNRNRGHATQEKNAELVKHFRIILNEGSFDVQNK